MGATVADKWVEGPAPGERPGGVVARALRGRLEAVLYYLPLAADQADQDVEYVHQLRVWSRRASAALGLFADLLPPRRLNWLERKLRQVRHAAGAARDCDVLLRGLHARPADRDWLEAVRAERAEAQREIAALHDRLRDGHRLRRQVDKLLQRVHARGRRQSGDDRRPFPDWARDRLRPVVERFFDAVPAGAADEAALHQLRIRGKELRYAMELLAGAFPEPLRARLYPAVEAIQDRLGEINDLATARSRLGRKLRAAPAHDAGPWRCRLAAEQARLDRARHDFWAWCPPQRFRALRREFEELLRDQDGRVLHHSPADDGGRVKNDAGVGPR